jgi:SEC-C motif domain protein
MKTHDILCPCKSGKMYPDCCKPYHKGKQLPKSALFLMRSRYSAYALALADYIMKTTHPDHPDMSKKKWNWREDILRFSERTEFIDLEVLADEEHTKKAFVTFTASLKQQGKDMSFTEKSYFEKVEGCWLYKSGEFL